MNILLNAIDALLITNPTNIRYLTGFVGAAPEEREAFALLTHDQLFLFINSLYLEASQKLSPAKRDLASRDNHLIQCIEISRENPFAKKLNQILTGLNPVNRLGFEEDNVSVAEYTNLKKELPGITLVPTRGTIEEHRMIKRDDEIKNIRAAAKLTDQCFDFILGKLKESVTESQIAWEIESFIKTRGASLAFSPIVAFGKNSSMPHYQPAESCKLTADSLILLDFGARVNGYCSDMTRTIFIGKPEAKWVKAYETVLQAQAAALEYLASSLPAEASAKEGPGFSNAIGINTDQIARNVIEKAGFPTYPHSLGHGVGLDIHEAPRLRVKPSPSSGQQVKPGPSERLSAGMILTVEPGIYIEGQYGIRIEDLILLKEDRIEILSKSDKNVIVL